MNEKELAELIDVIASMRKSSAWTEHLMMVLQIKLEDMCPEMKKKEKGKEKDDDDDIYDIGIGRIS